MNALCLPTAGPLAGKEPNAAGVSVGEKLATKDEGWSMLLLYDWGHQLCISVKLSGKVLQAISDPRLDPHHAIHDTRCAPLSNEMDSKQRSGILTTRYSNQWQRKGLVCR